MSTMILAHTLPSDFKKHEKEHWHALEHRWRPPFLLTTDNFGAATNVWRFDQLTSTSSNEGSDLQPVLLNPSLPPNPYATLTTAHIVSPNERFLAVALASDSSGSWRVYDLSTGSLISESAFPETRSYGYWGWQSAGEFAALTVKEGGKQVVLRYHLTDEGKLEHVGGVVPVSEGLDPELFGLEHLAKDGSIFTCTAELPSRRPLNIAYYPPHSNDTTIPGKLEIPFTTEGKDTIVAKHFIQVSERSLAFVVEENEWGADMNPIAALSTVRLATYTACTTPSDKPDISLSWTARLEHAIDEITYVPSLGTGAVVVRGRWHAPYAEDGSRGQDKLVLTFLDASTGTMLKQAEQAMERSGPSRCCTGPNWMVYETLAPTPWLYSIPLTRVMEIGLEGVENSDGQRDVQVKRVEVQTGPAPWNTKTKKSAAEGRWKWVKDVEVLPNGKLILFSERGPEFWVLDHTAINHA
jgi:hypothetical protein